MNIEALATQALACLLAQKPVSVTHEAGWQRPVGWPLPMEKKKPSADGTTTQNYRAIAILEYVDETLRPKKVRKADDGDEDLFGGGGDEDLFN